MSSRGFISVFGKYIQGSLGNASALFTHTYNMHWVSTFGGTSNSNPIICGSLSKTRFCAVLEVLIRSIVAFPDFTGQPQFRGFGGTHM